jgi:CBS domain-containing protein
MVKSDLMHTIQSACAIGVNLIPPTLLCDSIGLVGLKQPVMVLPDTRLSECISIMQERRIGSLLVVDTSGVLQGIFTERDCLMRVLGKVSDLSTTAVKDFMTANPITERPDVSLAFALNLMSNGGFRHIPIVDQDKMPIGVLSVKDVIDHIVNKMVQAIHEAVDSL